MKIRTSRLELVPATAEFIRMEMVHPISLGQVLDAVIPAAWPPESVRDVLELFAQELEANPNTEGWGGYYWLSSEENASRRTLIGSGGFKGKPDAHGNVEVGYGVLPEFQNKGYATEAVQGLVTWALSQKVVRSVIAEAFPDNVSSIRVLVKCGFVEVGAGEAPGVKRFEFLRIPIDETEKRQQRIMSADI